MIIFIRQLLICLCILFLSGCDETPINFYICDGNGEDCSLYAEFDDLRSCQRHEKFSNALCDSVSVPGEITCDTTIESTATTSYCAKNNSLFGI